MRFGILMLVAAALLIIAMMAITAPANASVVPEGWKIQFTIDESYDYVEVGANDNGSGFHVYPIHGAVNAALTGGYGARFYLGATTTFTDTLEIRPLSPTTSYTLRWQTYKWYPNAFYVPEPLDPYNAQGHVDGFFLMVVGFDGWLDLTQPGSITLDGDHDVTIYGNPVPEPSSLVALGTGAFGLLGLSLRRRRR